MPCLEKTCLKDFSTISNTNLSVQLVAHWHANFSRLFYEFSRTSLVRICKCRELVAKVPNMFKFFMRFFLLPKYVARLSRDCLATVIRRSCECSEYATTKFWRIYNAKISRHSYNCRMNVVRQSRDNLENTCEHLATIWREIKTRRHDRDQCW